MEASISLGQFFLQSVKEPAQKYGQLRGILFLLNLKKNGNPLLQTQKLRSTVTPV
jgi:hypothetical protein